MTQSPEDFRKLVDETHKLLSSTLDVTPLQFNQYLSEKHDAKIWLKREDLSPVRSYKIRGAYSFFNKAMAENSAKEFVCASAGNHAQGFAHACKHFGIKGWVFMPVTTPAQKIAKTKAFGEPFIEVKLIGDTFDETNLQALEFCKKKKALFVPPFDDEQVIIGQATVAAEILMQIPGGETIDMVILPVGGGGLAAGLTTYMHKQIPSENFTFVEPDGAPSFHRSLVMGKRAMLSDVDSFVDDAAVGQIGEKTFDRLKISALTKSSLAPTNGLCETMIEMLNIEGIVLEPAGALSIDALKRLPADKIKGRNIVCIVSGGNFDFERLPEVKERALNLVD